MTDVSVSPDGTFAIALRSRALLPPDVIRVDLRTGAVRPLTTLGSAAVAGRDLGAFGEHTAKSRDGTAVHGLLVKPPGFQRGRRYPLVVLVHGGPHGAWKDQWSWRWNVAMFASRGHVVAAPNFQGSSGYGEAFQDAIRMGWDRPLDDVLAFVDSVEALPFVERGRACAAGASYGGYLVNWIAGHSDRFRCLVSHAGLFDLRSMYYQTEELWFPEWELGGPPWKQEALYRRLSPSEYVEGMKTPTLVVHGEKDYRVVVGEALAMFTALQRRGVPSQLLVFPDEGHWVLKPKNFTFWAGTMLDWIDRWTR